MPLWPLPTGLVRLHNRQTAASTALTSVVTDASTAHTKGAWTQLVASTVDDSDAVTLRLGGLSLSATASPTLLDLGVGAQNAEQVLVPDIDIGNLNLPNHPIVTPIVIPVFIPAGSRIAARAQGARTSMTAPVGVDLVGGAGAVGGLPSAQKWTAYGVNAAASCGTVIDVPASTDTWSSWTEIATTSADHNWVLALLDHGAATVARAVTTLLQVAAGPNSTAADACAANGTLLWESVIIGTALEGIDHASLDAARWAPVPSGTKLWARAQSSSGTNNDVYVCIYGGS